MCRGRIGIGLRFIASQAAAFDLIVSFDLFAQCIEEFQKLAFVQQVELQFHLAVVYVEIAAVYSGLRRIGFLRCDIVAKTEGQILTAEFFQAFHPVQPVVVTDESCSSSLPYSAE